MNEQADLFELDDLYQTDKSKLEDVHIKTTPLFFEQKEHKEFRDMAKILIKKYWGDKYLEGNVSDLILKVFRNECKDI